MNEILYALYAVINQSAILLADLLPFVFAGALAGALLTVNKNKISVCLLKYRNPFFLIIVSAVLGSVSPLCTVGSVPVIAGLIECGFPAAAGITFLAASSLLTPQMVILAVASIGKYLTLIQVSGALAISISMGIIIHCLNTHGCRIFKPHCRTGRVKAASCIAEPCIEKGSAYNDGITKKVKMIAGTFLDQLGYILIFVIIGVLLASVMNLFIPASFYYNILSKGSPLMVTGSAVISIPGYTCGGSVFPIMCTLLRNGVSPGIIIAFILAGPATRLQALAALSTFLKRRYLVLYVGFLLGCSIVLGITVGFLNFINFQHTPDFLLAVCHQITR